jgi:hypothetical protein
VAGVLAVLSAACYTYIPVAPDTAPAVGERYALHISDQGRQGLAERFGPNLSRVEGRLTQVTPQEVALSVFRVDHLGAPGSTWAGEGVKIDRGYVARMDLRQLSRKRTYLAVGSAVAVVGWLALTKGLTGFFTGDTSEPTIPGPEQSIGFFRIAR